MRVLGLDIGGANLKAATETENALSEPFALWREPDCLAQRLAAIVNRFGDVELLAVTMTGELADCYETKADGIGRILRAVECAADGRAIRVWQTSGEFVSPDEAREEPLLTAAANWHALATFVGRLVPRGSAMLIDIGSTTSDLIPLLDGVPIPTGRTDVERLQFGELVYSGVRRTPISSIVHRVPFGDSDCGVAAELFATTLDVYLVLGDFLPSELDCETSNGRPATIAAAHDRIARMICGDRTEVGFEDVRRIAEIVAAEQLRNLADAAGMVASRLPSASHSVLISGSGSFLARRVAQATNGLRAAEITSLPELFGPRVSDAACAFALAKLATERELPFFGS